MKIAISGGTGFVGSILTEAMVKRGHRVTVLARAVRKDSAISEGALLVGYDPAKSGSWQQSIAEGDVIINLAGASIFRRWTPKAKKEIFDSRIITTRHIVEALSYSKGKKVHFFSISGVGYYGFCGDNILDESSPAGSDFLAQVAAAWESEALRAEELGARVVLCRLGHVLGSGGGVLRKFVAISNLHLASRWGHGQQWLSWIHREDMANIFLFLLDHQELEGPFNLTSPNPVRNVEMLTVLGQLLGKNSYVPPIPGFLLRLILREFATVFLRGQRVVPRRILDSGFRFKYPILDEALQDLLKRPK
jgi:uncharacterized protein (TIGR01777 family)